MVTIVPFNQQHSGSAKRPARRKRNNPNDLNLQLTAGLETKLNSLLGKPVSKAHRYLIRKLPPQFLRPSFETVLSTNENGNVRHVYSSQYQANAIDPPHAFDRFNIYIKDVKIVSNTPVNVTQRQCGFRVELLEDKNGNLCSYGFHLETSQR